MNAFSQIATWPVKNAAATVVDRNGIRASHGQLDHEFPLASVTKPLTALAALVAIEEGAICLDDPAGPPGSTVRHLLSHASGIDEVAVRAEPGTRRIYTNRSFDLLAEHIAQGTEMEFPDYLRQAVLTPLGMPNTYLAGSAAKDATSTAADLSTVVSELLAPQLLHPSTVKEATSVVFPGLSGVLPGFGRQENNDWGLGFEIRNHKSPHWTGSTNSPETYGHFGKSGTFIWVDPIAQLGCVVLTDTDFGPWAAEAWPVFSDAVLAEMR